MVQIPGCTYAILDIKFLAQYLRNLQPPCTMKVYAEEWNDLFNVATSRLVWFEGGYFTLFPFLVEMLVPLSKHFCWNSLRKWEQYTKLIEDNANLLKIY